LVEQQVEGQAKAHGLSREDVIKKVFLAEQPTGRFATIEEVAGTVVFLCGSAAASITGTALPVDGGWTAH
jgi:3-hydroxybutyrate dehydrogenase